MGRPFMFGMIRVATIVFTVGLLIDGDPIFLERLEEVHRVKTTSDYSDIVLYQISPKR